jgi:wobble nucleotide-excising tRNase
VLKKIITKNVGVLRAFETPAAPQLAKLTAIYARNGRGKTTLSAVLRAAGAADDSVVLGRQTLGNGGGTPEVTLLFDKGESPVRFTGQKWSTRSAPIEVFDSTFIADNLYAGERVDLEHDRKLFAVILGREGVKLERQQVFFNAAAKAAAAKLKDAEVSLLSDIPSDMTREEFLGLVPAAALDEQIDQADKQLRAVRQATRVQSLKLLQQIAIPELTIDCSAVLAGTVADIQAGAREQLAQHFKKHKLGREGEQWVRFGRDHIVDDACPFCGREDVNDLGLVTLYDQIFGESYQAHLQTVKKAADHVEEAIGSRAREAVTRIISTNADTAREWSEFCKLDGVVMSDLNPVLDGLERAHSRLQDLFDQKRQTPLDVIEGKGEIALAERELTDAALAIGAYNRAVEAINAIVKIRQSGSPISEAQAKTKLDNLAKRKRRHDVGVQARINTMLRAKARDTRAKRIRLLVQTRLKKANESAAEHYHVQVNHYLERFGATFRISKISNSMQGNLGSVDYGLVVRGHPVARGRKGATDAEPTFKNTLSTGDKTTLAFAFFLAGLDRDSGLANKVIVFDDPLSSHDDHREGRTVDLIYALCGRCEQLIILSHKAFFLKRVLERCPTVDQVTYEIMFEGAEQWSRARVVNIDDLCRSAYNRLVDDLHAYHEHKAGDPIHIAPSVRKVLETYYRQTFPAYFERDDWLGAIIKKIRDEGPTHPCFSDLMDLECCNAGTKNEHHGDDPEVAPAPPMDPDALAVIVRDCLQLVNVLKRPTNAAGIGSFAIAEGAIGE